MKQAISCCRRRHPQTHSAGDRLPVRLCKLSWPREIERWQETYLKGISAHHCTDAWTLLQARAAQQETEEWHEGLREYPDMSLAPRLRQRLLRQRQRDIQAAVQSRFLGLQLLDLSENQVRKLAGSVGLSLSGNRASHRCAKHAPGAAGPGGGASAQSMALRHNVRSQQGRQWGGVVISRSRGALPCELPKATLPERHAAACLPRLHEQ